MRAREGLHRLGSDQDLGTKRLLVYSTMNSQRDLQKCLIYELLHVFICPVS